MRRDASAYIRANFRPEDRLAVVMIQQTGEQKGQVKQRFWSAEMAAWPKTQAWLRYQNKQGWDIYASANPLKPGVRGRHKEDVLEARWLYLDIDRDGDATLKRIDDDAEAGRIPQPTAVVNTSPGRYQVLWRIRGAETDRAEDMLRRLAHHYGTDRAATDCARVLRLPGFRSCKRDAPVRLLRYRQGPPSGLQDFPQDLPLPHGSWAARTEDPVGRGEAGSRSAGGDTSKSGQDWAWTREQLRRGRNVAEVRAELAARRPDKSNPGQYASRTVDNAQRSLEDAIGRSR